MGARHGATLVDADGKEFIDGLAGLWNVVLGHGRRDLAEAAREQIETLAYASGYCGSSNLRAIELAERLARLTYPNITRFFFTSGGAEANESAIKLARSYWKSRGRPGKTKVISRELGYHGSTLATMSATGIAGYWTAFEPRVPGFIHVPPLSATALEEAIVRAGADTVAMFLAEPVIGVGGVIVPPARHEDAVRARGAGRGAHSRRRIAEILTSATKAVLGWALGPSFFVTDEAPRTKY